MNVLVDTNIWSLALRRTRKQSTPREQKLTYALRDLIVENRVVLVGPVRHELLSGIKDPQAFERLRGYLRSFESSPIGTAEFESAAEVFNACARKGVVGSAIDMLICAIALSNNQEIFTTDPDFQHYARCVPIRLFETP